VFNCIIIKLIVINHRLTYLLNMFNNKVKCKLILSRLLKESGVRICSD